MSAPVRLRGHVWTVWPHVRDLARPPRAPQLGRPWHCYASDEIHGAVRLSGIYHPRPGAEAIALIVHGMGGSAESSYCRRTSAAADALGMASLRINLRGADGSGEDLFHVGQWSDLRAALDTPEIAQYRVAVAIGFSLGGHSVLRLATEDPGQLAAVAAVCSPLDLAASVDHIDSPKISRLYREHLLSGLREMYAAVAAREALPLEPADVMAIQRVRQWDERVIVPRFGFSSTEEYYRRECVAPRLAALRVPALYLGSADDPMISADIVRRVLASPYPRLTVEWLERTAGHVGFPLRAGQERRVLEWLLAAAQTGAGTADQAQSGSR